MRKIVYAVLTTISALVLILSYRTSHPDPEQPAPAPPPASSMGGSTSGGTPTDVRPPGGTGLADGTYAGETARTRYGPVQVQISISGGRITDVQVPQYPSDNSRDRQISGRAIPRLMSETTAAQSADIDMVSGATYTSEGYRQSLQSAIDRARA